MNTLCTFPATRVLTRLEATEQAVIDKQDEYIKVCFAAQHEFSKRNNDYHEFKVEL